MIIIRSALIVAVFAGWAFTGCSTSESMATHDLPYWDGRPGRGTATWIEPKVKPGEQEQLNKSLTIGMSKKQALIALGLQNEPPNEWHYPDLHIGAGLVYLTYQSPLYPDAWIQLCFNLPPPGTDPTEDRLACWGFRHKPISFDG